MTAIQEKIADVQRRFQMLVQDSDDIFEIIDTDGIIQYISPAVEKVIGYSPNEITGKNILNFVEGADKITLKEMIGLVIRKS
ncbi:MAG: PAS domain-containing protein [Alkalibacterium sp.]|nr:PAS domain-containing protein [Alkalibacterium sp.]